MATSSIEEGMARLEGSYEQINLRLGRLEEETRALRVEIRDGLNSLKAELNNRIDRLESRIDHLDGKMDRLFYLMVALMGGVIAAIVAVILSRTDIAILTKSDTLDGNDVVPGWTLPIADLFA